jgi:hypothetical protein
MGLIRLQTTKQGSIILFSGKKVINRSHYWLLLAFLISPDLQKMNLKRETVLLSDYKRTSRNVSLS